MMKYLAAACIALAATFSPLSFGKTLDRIAAIVDEDLIMESEVERRISSIKGQIQKSKVALPPEDVLRKQVMEQLIIESIQLQMAEMSGFKINDQQLNGLIERIAQQNKMSVDQFKRALKKDGVSYADAREQIRRERIISDLQRMRVGSLIRISDQDVDGFLSSEQGRIGTSAEYQLGHILIQVPSQATSSELDKAKAKADKILADLNKGADFKKTAIAKSDGQNALKGGDLGWRKGIELPSIFANAVPKMKVGEVSQPIRSGSGYHLIKLIKKRGGASKIIDQAKVRHILISPNEIRDEQASKKLINELYSRAKKGEDFAALAKEFSDDPGSGSQGGDLGWVDDGKMVPVFEKTFKKTKTGNISKPFKSQFGWHFLQVTDRRKTDVGSMIQKNQARNLIFARRFEEELPIWLRKIRAESYVEVKSY